METKFEFKQDSLVCPSHQNIDSKVVTTIIGIDNTCMLAHCIAWFKSVTTKYQTIVSVKVKR